MSGGVPGRDVLIFRTGQLGDALVALPAIQAVRLKHPGERVVLLTDRHPARADYVATRDVVEPTGWVDEIVAYVPAATPAARAGNLLRLRRRFGQRVERVYDLSQPRTPAQALRDRVFFRLVLGARHVRTPGVWVPPAKGPDGTLPRVAPEWRRLLDVVGETGGAAGFRLPIPAGERERARLVLDEERLGGEGVAVCLGIGSKRQTTRWPLERYAELGRELLARHESVELVVVGGAGDRADGERLCGGWGARSHNLAGRLSIYGSAAAMQRCALFVGNDSGVLHLAAMAGVRCVGIHGARNPPGRWEPFGEGHVTLRHPIACEGCRLEECRDRGGACIREVSVGEVLVAAEAALRRDGAQAA